MPFENNQKPLLFFLLFAFLVIFGRLFQLQVVNGKENRFLAENNRIQKMVIEAPRGLIFDRHGEVLAQNEPVYLNNQKKIGRDKALKLQEEGKDINLQIGLRRKYPKGESFAHLVGYLGEITENEIKEDRLKFKGYRLGGLTGRAGVEAWYEEELKGHDGSELAEVNTQGEIIRRMGKILPSPGESLTLAADKNLQETAVDAFNKGTGGKRSGAVVAVNPKNGEILAFYSASSFDPNLFVEKDERLVKIVTDEKNKPLFNRVVSGTYAPGSTFKIVTSIAGLEEGKITTGTKFKDTGVIWVGDFSYSNWYYTAYGRTEGEISLTRAIARSTDTFFYKLGEWVGPEKLYFWAEKFGLTKKYGIDLPAEVPGFMATPEWKMKERNEPWFLGNTYHLAIGQGDLSLTPLGVNMMTSAVANGGKICTPRVLRIGAENTPYKEDCRDIGIKKENINTVKQGMIQACTPGGTGWPFFDFKPEGLPRLGGVACKTGTAETGDGKTAHAWFTVFAPTENPEIVLTVLVEKGGEGSSVAGPIAKEILTEYFREHRE